MLPGTTNQTRMRDTRILVGIILLAVVFTAPALREGSFPYEILRLAGYVMLAACAIGRIYSTAFIGGVKSEKLITVGPYSMCRNPLYFYSLLGAAGLGLLTGEIIPTVIITGGFLFVYKDLILREEEYLSEKFGQSFADYKASTPRLLPDLKKYNVPEELTFQPKYLNKAVWDAVWWFAPAPVYELIHALHHAHIIKPLFSML
jgi:protein-S-isoprenylcysteine O-methyltransferase Ste14